MFENPPIRTHELTIHIVVDNKALSEELNSSKTEMMTFLRTELKNFSLQVTTEINKNIQTKKAYTPHEKFNKMVQKNPLLKELKQQLDLDIGYAH